MEEIEVSNWEGFELEIRKLRENLSKNSSPLFFRGQSNSNSEWQLTTTLERQGKEGMRVAEYYQLIARVGPAVETFTGMNWELSDLRIGESLPPGEFDPFPSDAIYQYVVYLRHHGFPSPLLDWSRSQYVAAFFAFRDSGKDVQKRSIYVFCEMPGGTKSFWEREPIIRRIVRNVRSHPRHFRQQSEYTVCGFLDGSTWRFHPHEKVSASGKSRQDRLWKFNLPSTERIEVLRLLDNYNLNSYSLFDSEESLMETMWVREAVLREGRRP